MSKTEQRVFPRVFITCVKGSADTLAREVEALGFEVTDELDAGVFISKCSFDETMLLNLHLRTAHRVLGELYSFEAFDADNLYFAARSFPWEDLLSPDGYFSITSSVDNESIRDTQFARLRLKDAIADRMTDRLGRRPDSGNQRTAAVIHLHWKGDACTVYADTSGDPLSNRGYRKIPKAAPMRETLAAAVVLETGWQGEGHFINPMCGSGTLAIEAALIALNRAPGTLRSGYGFQHLLGFNDEVWQEMRRQARLKGLKRFKGRIIATDIDPEAVEAARRNARTAGVEQVIEFAVCDFAATEVPEGDGGVVVMNPEYGQRLGKEARLEETYALIGDFFKQRCGGYTGYLFSGNLPLLKRVGLRTSRKKILFNGPIECRLARYELYRGTRRDMPAES